MAPKGLTAKEVVQRPIPALAVGVNYTRSSALHPILFVGALAPWPDFEVSVRQTIESFRWYRRVVQHEQRSGYIPPWNVTIEHTRVGDEGEVQGRFNQHVSQLGSAVFRSQEIDLVLGDFRATTAAYRRVPDVAAATTSSGQLRFVGELKTPWVHDHKLAEALGGGNERHVRHIFGQIARYMQETRLKYGFISNYEETIFLRQVLDPAGHWELQYSKDGGHVAPNNLDWVEPLD
ncbi:hypothetical protein BO78DRAFT_403753 [Aspergillus sclerotiicarbonarius CBS 121057]|uniref:Uncharacterized protein n=1 Tax=Aspergillus sclerotiicarbonarius (strain CBS 121057 / IBT 28362) TaxID=1448318 RepID=A0A319EK91_ASPSB|nr:hypothetical protein BO78DRAFT_403753 [Aspergillus sclerotiicarbonarius CBS 121057]